LGKLSHEGRLVIASHHDLASTADLFDEALVLSTRALAFGTVREILTDALVDRAFGQITPAS